MDIGGGIVAGRGAKSAYLFGPERNGAPRRLYQLLSEGYRVSVSTEPIDAGGRHWPRGTYVAHVARNDSSLAARIDVLARESGVDVVGVNSAQAGAGQYGIGSESMVSDSHTGDRHRRRRGRIADAYGAIWYTLERRYGIRFTPIAMSPLGGDLSRFTAILLPSGSYARMCRRTRSSG